jgi:hypothetical protein
MPNIIEYAFINICNRLSQARREKLTGGLPLGMIVRDERVTKTPFYIPTAQRTQHITILGKTGTGKTSFIRHLIQHDINAGRGLAAIDIHGDIVPAVLRYTAEKHPEFAARVVVIDPTNTAWAVGMNPLEVGDEYARFREVAAVTRGLADKWNFHGARTEELLRNALFVLSANGLTPLEVGILLSDDEYRKSLLKSVANQETLGNLFLTKMTAAIFRRKRRDLFTIYADEMQNLASADTDFETLFSEARKFGVGIVTGNQFQNQLPQTLRSAIQAIGTRVFFQCSPEDSAQVAQEIDGGRTMAERLRNLPQRHAIVRSGTFRPCEVVTPTITNATASTVSFLEESNRIHARRKTEIDADILARRPKPQNQKEVIDGWD